MAKSLGSWAGVTFTAPFLAVQVEIAFVFRMNGNGHVAEHGLRTRGGYREKLACIFTIRTHYGIANLP